MLTHLFTPHLCTRRASDDDKYGTTTTTTVRRCALRTRLPHLPRPPFSLHVALSRPRSNFTSYFPKKKNKLSTILFDLFTAPTTPPSPFAPIHMPSHHSCHPHLFAEAAHCAAHSIWASVTTCVMMMMMAPRRHCALATATLQSARCNMRNDNDAPPIP